MGSGGSLLRHRGLSSALAFVMAMVTFVVAGTPQIAQAAPVSVCESGCDFATVSAAVAAPSTVSGDVITVAAGTYFESTIQLVEKSLTIQGAGSGVTILDGSTAGFRVMNLWGATTVELSGLTITGGDAGASMGGGVSLAPSGGSAPPTVIMTDVEIIGNSSNTHGGGIENNGATLTLDSSDVINNTGGGNGGGIYNYNGGTVTVTDTAVSGNTAAQGGGIHGFGGSLTIENATLSANTSTGGGGAISISDATTSATIVGTTIDGNRAVTGGGGVSASAGTMMIGESTVSNNVAALAGLITIENDSTGSGVACPSGVVGGIGQTFTAVDETISGFAFDISVGSAFPGPGSVMNGRLRQGDENGPLIATASFVVPVGGAASGFHQYDFDMPVGLVVGQTYAMEIDMFDANVFIVGQDTANQYLGGYEYSECTNLGPIASPTVDLDFRVVGSPAGSGGGVLSIDGGFVGIENSTISGNTGAGVFVSPSSTVSLDSSTVTANSGTGIFAELLGAGIDLFGTLVADNGTSDCEGGLTNVSFSLIEVNNCGILTGADNQLGTADPGLGPLADNTGPTLTHAIVVGSLAHDASGPTCLATDQRGIIRPQGGDV